MPIYAQADQWILETQNSGYALGLTWEGLLAHRYWGKRLPQAQDYPPAQPILPWASFDSSAGMTPEEYPPAGGMRYIEPCLKATFADGTRDVVLQFKGHEVLEGPAEHLILRFQDEFYPFTVALHYRLHPAQDLIERWAELSNTGAEPITLEQAFSAQWHLPAGRAYQLSYLTGRWFDEFHLRRERLGLGTKVLESRRLTTGHQYNPWFAVEAGEASEEAGEVWFGALAWSGNWKLAAEQTEFGGPRLSLGVNDWDFAWNLKPGETFITPGCIAGYTNSGFGSASRQMHAYIHAQVLPHRPAMHKVLYNSWEATAFDVDEPSQVRLAELAAGMGVELFVMDDGWFKGRVADYAGLGDWQPDPQKFPQGLRPLIEKVNALGMDFGLWVEPEMVNPNSDLYRAHPEWAIHFPHRRRTEARNQLILNFAIPEVQDYILAQLDQLLSENNIAFIKWDMNRNVSEPGWPAASGDPRELWVRYVQGLYRVWGELRARHPAVIFQSCSGGGGRDDLGILRLADQIWVSDNTIATSRLGIQAGFSHVFPANTMEAWVTDAGRDQLPLAFRFHVSMCGSLGVGGNLLRWSEAERAEAARWIKLYKEIRPIVQLGDQYRLLPAQGSACSAVQYLSQDGSQGVLFGFRTYLPEPARFPKVYLCGLDPAGRYTVEGEGGPRSGLAWMQAGLDLPLGHFESTVRRIQRVK